MALGTHAGVLDAAAMRIHKILITVAGVLALLGSVLLVAPASASTLPYAYGVYPSGGLSWSYPTIRPPEVHFGTDSGLMYRSMSWGYWNNSGAWGKGVRWYNSCIPTCAAGNYWKSPGTVTLWGVKWHNGHRYFSLMTLRWTTKNGVQHKVVYSYATHGGTVVFWG
jgi:hypothetical protein